MSDTKSHEHHSFSYKVINEKIQEQLDLRSKLNNTAQIGMPFVKVTSTLQLPSIMGDGNFGFTLGTHVIQKDVTYQDIYASRNSSEGPLIGYTYTPDGANKLVYALEDDLAIAIRKELGAIPYTTPNTLFKAVPPPGITNVKISLNKAGVISQGEITINIPTLIQLETLSKTFLVPGVGMILEWGQQFANYGKFTTGLTTSSIDNNMFPWYNRTKLVDMLTRLGERKVGIEEIYQNYVYPTNGQYQWMFGRVGNFNTKLQSDGSYVSTVKIIGQHEESWAYSVRNPIARPVDRSKLSCIEKTNSIENFFSNTSSGINFKSLLDKIYNDKSNPWNKHVIFITGGNESTGEATKDNPNSKPTVNEDKFANSTNAYFITWKCFVNVILNSTDPNLPGLKYVFLQAIRDENYTNKIGLLRPYTSDDDPYENYVGANKHLRSVDPSTLIIVNETAVTEFQRQAQDIGKFIEPSDFSKQMLELGDFYQSAKNCTHIQENQNTDPDKGFLSTGVWLNHKAIVETMINGPTFVDGMSNLLERMNTATKGFWQLSLDTQEPLPKEDQDINYAVVDSNYKSTSTAAVNRFIKDVYTFNKLIKEKNGELYGSDSIECDIELTLPKLLFSQIAVLGMVKQEDIDAVNTVQTEGGQSTTLGVATDAEGKQIPSPFITNNNTRLEKMFGMTLIDPKNLQSNPDLTYKLRSVPTQPDVCGAVSAGAPANTQGTGQTVSKPAVASSVTNTPTTQRTDTFTQFAANTAWSAGFISYVMKTAGVTFPAAGSHTQYAQTLRTGGAGFISPTAAQQGDFSGWQALDPQTTPIRVGDLVVQNRSGNKLTFATPTWSGFSHGDIITEVNQGNAVGVGGNVGNTVKGTRFPLNRNNILTNRNFFVVLRPPQGVISSIVRVTTAEFNKWVTNKWKETTSAAADTLRSYYSAGNIPVPNNNQQPVTTSTTNTSQETQATDIEQQLRKYENLNTMFRYVEPFADNMVVRIAGESDGNTSNPFGISPGPLTIKTNMTLPGINGIRVGQLFWIDRIPAVYKLFGAFQIMSMSHSFDVGGWKTTITAAYNYLGRAWREAIVREVKLPSNSVSSGEPITNLDEAEAG